MNSVMIVSAVRTAIGKMGGSLKTVMPEDLSKLVIEGAINKIELDNSLIDQVILGQTKQSSDAPNIARVAALKAGIPEEVPSYTVHMQCSSGMQAIISAVWQIQCGYADVVLAGGVESMSNAPYYLRQARYGYVAGNGVLVDPNTESQPKAQPEEIYGSFSMGKTAENLADKYNINRLDQDNFALCSHKKAIAAIDGGLFAEEIIPVSVRQKKTDSIFDTDEFPRRDTDLVKLSKLPPAFISDGTVTAGNSSGRNDGAAAVILMSEKKAKEIGIKPLARFVSAGLAGVDPRFMGIGPVPATKKALSRAGLTLDEIDLIELNEAFAAQSLSVIQELQLNMEILNVNGGAIALGHPLGCSGARIVVTLLHEMVRRKNRLGLATICVAGGLGAACIFERFDR